MKGDCTEMKKLLVVIDMQNDFVDGSLGTEEAMKIVPEVQARIEQHKSEGQEVVFTMDTHYDNYLETLERTFRWNIAKRRQKDGSSAALLAGMKGSVLKSRRSEVWNWRHMPGIRIMTQLSWWACVRISALYLTHFFLKRCFRALRSV